jgi:hypothetical protein
MFEYDQGSQRRLLAFDVNVLAGLPSLLQNKL